MKWIVAAVVCLAVSGFSASPQSTRGEKENLGLTTRILEVRYCDSGYEDMALLKMSLQLTYLNSGKRPLILYSWTPLPDYVLVSLNNENATNKRYELNQHIGWITARSSKLAERSEHDDEFVVLAVGQSYRAKTEISIPIARDESTKFLKPGSHVLQIVVETWPEEESQFDRLRKKWIKTGLLCGSNVRSEPESFEVQEHPKLEQCH